MERYVQEDYKSDLPYRIKYVEGAHAKDSARKDFHSSVHLLLIHFAEGRGRLVVAGVVYELKPGDVLLLNPSELFLLEIDDDCFHRRMVLHTNINMVKSFPCDCSEIFLSLYKRKMGTGNIIAAETARAFGLDALFSSLLNAAREESPLREPLIVCKMVELLCRVNQIISGGTTENANRVIEDTLINRVLEYIGAHCREDICVQDIADRFRVNRSYLLHRFKQKMGISLWNYVILRRINLFNNSLSDHVSLETAAYSVGFTNYSNFYRLYKKYMGITPLEFKQQMVSSPGDASADI